MNVKEFMQIIGGRHATIMVCQVDGSQFNGSVYKAGDMVNVQSATALGLYEQFANGTDGDIRRWIPKDANITAREAQLINEHFNKEHAKETGDAPVQITSTKKSK